MHTFKDLYVCHLNILGVGDLTGIVCPCPFNNINKSGEKKQLFLNVMVFKTEN